MRTIDKLTAIYDRWESTRYYYQQQKRSYNNFKEFGMYDSANIYSEYMVTTRKRIRHLQALYFEVLKDLNNEIRENEV